MVLLLLEINKNLLKMNVLFSDLIEEVNVDVVFLNKR